jgi:hypothetical protein
MQRVMRIDKTAFPDVRFPSEETIKAIVFFPPDIDVGSGKESLVGRRLSFILPFLSFRLK